MFLDIDETMIHCIDDRDPPNMVATEHLIISVPAEIGLKE